MNIFNDLELKGGDSQAHSNQEQSNQASHALSQEASWVCQAQGYHVGGRTWWDTAHGGPDATRRAAEKEAMDNCHKKQMQACSPGPCFEE